MHKSLLTGLSGCFFSLASLVSCAQTIPTPTGSGRLDAYWGLPLSTTLGAETQVLSSPAAIADPASPANAIALTQTGIDNQASLHIESGHANWLQLSQVGQTNTVIATLVGSNNSLVVNQLGTSNSFQFGLNGDNNRFLLTQDGDDKLLLLGLQQNNTFLDVSQQAGSNSLTIDNTRLDAFSTGLSHLRIEQSGGATVVIQQGKIIGN